MKLSVFASVLVLLLSVDVYGQQFYPNKQPVAPDGTEATCDIPPEQHIRNVGGRDSAGLCVFSSYELMLRWHNQTDWVGFQRWMTKYNGGGWPEKLDKMVAMYAKEKGIPVPTYIQHTGGDASFLDLAIKTDRMVCVTYSGNDDFYRGSVAHMVNLVALTEKWAAIIDNNRPTVWVWMSRSDFLKRWRAMSGGWAVVFLGPPPPPHLPNKTALTASCICGSECKCATGDCPGKCPTYCQCPGGRCPSPSIRLPLPFPSIRPALPSPPSNAVPTPIGQAPSAEHVWGRFDNGEWGWKLKPKTEQKPEPEVEKKPKDGDEPIENYGVDFSKIHKGQRYTLPDGQEVSKGVAHAFMAGGLVDDSHRWHLNVVGDEAFRKKVKDDLSRLTQDQRDRLHCQFYAPDSWAVSLFKLPSGVSLRKPSPGRVSEEVGHISVADYNLDLLLLLLQMLDGVKPKPPTPAPQPVPIPIPTPVPVPSPTPTPTPTPEPVPPTTPNWPLLALIAGVLYLLFRKKP